MIGFIAPRALPAVVLIVSTVAVTACGGAKSLPLAPSDATMALFTDGSSIPVNGTTTIVIDVKRYDGTSVGATDVALQTTLGQLDQSKVTLKDGTASVVYRAGPSTGTARITATSGTLSAELSLTVGAPQAGSISVFPTPAVLPDGGGETEVVATV